MTNVSLSAGQAYRVVVDVYALISGVSGNHADVDFMTDGVVQRRLLLHSIQVGF